MRLDSTETCNGLGEVRLTVFWGGLLVVLFLLPFAAVGLIATIGGAIGCGSSGS